MTTLNATAWSPTINGLRLCFYVKQDEKGRPVEIRIFGGGPLSQALTDLAEALTISLRHGVGFGVFTRTFRGRRDETAGPVQGDPYVSECGSVVDYIAQALDARYA